MSEELDLEGRRFEELLAMLQQTVARLDGDQLTLNEAVDAYERCVAIASACTRLLDEAELRVTRLSTTNHGIREMTETYAVDNLSARRLLLGEDDDLNDLLEYDDEP